MGLRKFILKRLIEGEKGVVLKVGEISASHPNPLHAHRLVHWDKAGSLYKQK